MQEMELERKVTQEGAVAIAVEFCRKAKRPNVLPDNSCLLLGRGGLSMFDGVEATTVRKVTFPLMTEFPAACSSKVLQDVKSASEFLNEGAMLFCSGDSVTQLYFVACPERGVSARIPGTVIEGDDTLKKRVGTLIEKTMTYYSEIFKKISDAAFPAK